MDLPTAKLAKIPALVPAPTAAAPPCATLASTPATPLLLMRIAAAARALLNGTPKRRTAKPEAVTSRAGPLRTRGRLAIRRCGNAKRATAATSFRLLAPRAREGAVATTFPVAAWTAAFTKPFANAADCLATLRLGGAVATAPFEAAAAAAAAATTGAGFVGDGTGFTTGDAARNGCVTSRCTFVAPAPVVTLVPPPLPPRKAAVAKLAPPPMPASFDVLATCLFRSWI
mmetsp:Transcript_116523/g.329580  ORF Transcript_116523/g.329580 Transcript_116523/m.329580 type:complete len:229 (-) Transcript_116523:102-788(-)